MQTALLSYDICAPPRLRRVAKLLEDHGTRIQQSVFVCTLSVAEVESLIDAALSLMECPPDHLFVLPLCARCRDAIEQHGIEIQLPSETSCYIA